MSLSSADETFIKNLKKKADIDQAIKSLNQIAVDAIEVKKSEIKSIQDKLITDVNVEKAKL